MTSKQTLSAATFAAFSVVAAAQTGAQQRQWTIALTSGAGLKPRGVGVTPATHQGQNAVRIVNIGAANGEGYAVVDGPMLENGTIELDIAGRPQAGAAEGARGFVGVAFRVKLDDSAFECFYIRPTNGRADDQLRRNHSTQYISFPGFPWQKLRQENPGVYESYVDLVSGEWTHLRVAFNGKRAQLFVNGAPQPVLIVNDLKQPPAAGGVALWIGAETEAFFKNLKVIGD